jgi:UDP-N-acetylglucosamine 2-epimerase (non-hydrolysing)/GDP/UDP-N,N'-diacetylbacillosamine 2-epimerase (hydrolysing)
MKKICVVTGSRAEYGLLQGLMQEIETDSSLELQIIVTGAHLSPEYGLTFHMIENDGFFINEKVEMLLSSDTAIGMTKSLGLGIICFADALDRLHPDILVLLGDRYEILAAAQAALLARIPVAHIAGGEITVGAVDELIRHAITKMAHLHFVASEVYRKRVIQLGENPACVFNVGSTGIDYLKKCQLLSRLELAQSLDFDLGKILFLITYHPPTLEPNTINGVKEMLGALDQFPDANLIITGSNADMGGKEINKVLHEYAGNNSDRVYFSISLGQQRYLSAMQQCNVIIGNSSSAIIEAPALKKAVVNIGSRQSGRLKADCIIECEAKQAHIKAAIEHALSSEFQANLPAVKSLYGEGNSARNIKDILKNANLVEIMKKKFYDLNFHIDE